MPGPGLLAAVMLYGWRVGLVYSLVGIVLFILYAVLFHAVLWMGIVLVTGVTKLVRRVFTRR